MNEKNDELYHRNGAKLWPRAVAYALTTFACVVLLAELVLIAISAFN